MGNPDSIIGCDYSGTVQTLGSGVSKWKVGDKVCGVTHGGKFPNKGAFAEYLVIKEEYVAGIPDGMDGAEAATYGVGFYTAAMVSSIQTRMADEIGPFQCTRILLPSRSTKEWMGKSANALHQP